MTCVNVYKKQISALAVTKRYKQQCTISKRDEF